MRVLQVIAAIALGASLLAEPAIAQMRPIPGYGAPPGPNPLLLIPRKPPSWAYNRALMNNPGARVLGVVPNGAGYNVRLKRANQIYLYPVPGN